MNRIARRVMILAFLGLVAACQTGSNQLKGASMRIEFDALERGGERLTISLLVFNPNDHPVQIERASFDFELDGQRPMTRALALDLDIAPRNRERVQIRLESAPETIHLLESLDAGERTRLAYRLEGELQLRERRPTRTRIEAFLHPVPGQPGRYR